MARKTSPSTIETATVPPPTLEKQPKKSRKASEVVVPEAPEVTEAAPKKGRKQKVVEPPIPPVIIEEPVVEEEIMEEDKEDITIDHFLAQCESEIQSMGIHLSQSKLCLRSAKKASGKQARLMERLVKKKNKKSKSGEEGSKKAPGGFTRPTKVSDEMADFLGIPHGGLASRLDATQKIHAYINENNLKGVEGSEDHRMLSPDVKLTSLFGEEQVKKAQAAYAISKNFKDNINYLKLQSYIKHHFSKKEAAAKQAEA